MERVPQFKIDGDLSLSLPVAQGFEKTLHDFVLLATSRSGFTTEDSSRVAGQSSSLL